MNRRTFLSLSATAALSRSGAAAPAPVNKREHMLAWLAGQGAPNYTPAAFFLHFGDAYKAGPAAAQRHLEFFRHTGMDFVKIQFEQTYSRQDFLQKPADWSKLKLQKLDFYEPLLVTVRELVKAEKKNALLLMTLYSPFMCAGHCATAPVLLRHLEENPEAVKKGLEILTESQLLFVRACIQEGHRRLLHLHPGRGSRALPQPRHLQPLRQALRPGRAQGDRRRLPVQHPPRLRLRRALRQLRCRPRLPRPRRQLQREALRQPHFRPGNQPSCSSAPSWAALDRHGIVASGTPAQIEAEIRQVVKTAPRPFLLGADCTVEAGTSWDRLKHAISVAHQVGA